MAFKPAKWPRKLRSQEWFGGTSKDAIYHRSWMKNQGLPADLLDGRPVVGICNTWSELTPCNAHLRDLAEKVKFGVYEAGGFPVEFPVFSARRKQPAPHRHDVPQPVCDGRGRGDPRHVDGRCCAAGGL